MKIQIKCAETAKKLEEFKKVENIKTNTKALERLLQQSDELVLIESKLLKLEQKKTL